LTPQKNGENQEKQFGSEIMLPVGDVENDLTTLNELFEAHHIKPFKHKQFRTKVANLILVCNPCHNWIHSKRNIKVKIPLR